jgi:hypothetical protein
VAGPNYLSGPSVGFYPNFPPGITSFEHEVNQEHQALKPNYLDQMI